MSRRPWAIPALLLMLVLLTPQGCSRSAEPVEILTILACPEVKEVEPAILQAAQARRLEVRLLYKSPADIMLDLQAPPFPCDAVLTANLPWIALGTTPPDARQQVREAASIMHSPVILGLRRRVAKSLEWRDRAVSTAEILRAVRSGALRYVMASPTQSTSGAAAGMGLLVALAGATEAPGSPAAPGALSRAQLDDPVLQAQARDFLAGVVRTAAGSMLLRDLFLSMQPRLEAMLNDEAMLLAANQHLVSHGEEPLDLIYPSDGLALADFTLAFVERADNKHKLERFIELRNTLLEPDAQQAFTAAGYRTSLLGMNTRQADRSLFNPAWGVDLSRPLAPIRWPEPATLLDALTRIRMDLRKPSATVYVLDTRPPGLQQRKDALAALLDPHREDRTGSALLQPGTRDLTIVLPFGASTNGTSTPALPGPAVLSAQGNDPATLAALRAEIEALPATPSGPSALAPVLTAALDQLLAQGDVLTAWPGMLPSVILLTGGNVVLPAPAALHAHWRTRGEAVPLPPCYVVATDAAAAEALPALAQLAAGRLFEGHILGVEAALRLAKGGN
ncbi:hypothetical protein [Megalodesulfovibrio paquesii]